MKKLLYILPLLILFSACYSKKDKEKIDLSDEPTVPKEITRAETYYDLTISEQTKFMESGDSAVFLEYVSNIVQSSSWDIETNWDRNLGIITFTSENPGSSPYPTVSIVYDLTSGRDTSAGIYEYVYDLAQTNVSLQDVLIGTAAELNARTYKYPYLEFDNIKPTLFIDEIGTNYIEGAIQTQVFKPIWVQNRFTGEVIEATLLCKFRVCTRC